MSKLEDWYKNTLKEIDPGDCDSPKYAIAAGSGNGELPHPEWLVYGIEYGNWQIWDSADPFKAIKL